MISKEKLDEIARRVCMDQFIDMTSTDAKNFAHALLVEVQKELEVVGHIVIDADGDKVICHKKPKMHASTPLTTLPMVEE